MGAKTKYGLPGIYNSSALVLADGDGVALAVDSSGRLINNMGTRLDPLNDGVTNRVYGNAWVNLTASARIGGTATVLVLVGMYVNSTSSGTIKFWDQTSAAVPVLNNTITPAVGWHMLGNAKTTNGLYATIANTLDVTIYYFDPTSQT